MPGLADIAPESVLLAGAGRAILLQIAYPEIGYGVARHSDFAARPMDRLNATLSYIYALASGSDDDVRAVRRAVNRAHAGVRNPPGARAAAAAGPPAVAPGAAAAPGAGPAAVPHYDARDPHLQLWVAATLYDTAVTVYEKVFGALDDDEADRVYREYAVLGTALQMPDELWPATRADFRAYWNDTLPKLRVDGTVRGVADALLRAEKAPLAIRKAMPLARLVTVALLPDVVRQEFGFAWSERRERRFERLVRITVPVYRVLPRTVRQWPQRHYLARLRSERGGGRGR
jgi:uncharacterized protein (DUF2236 family)